MENTRTLLQRHNRFEELVSDCDRNELTVCLRLLGMYLGMYKRCFGEIPVEDYAGLLQAVSLDGELGQIVDSGLQEATAMLEMVKLDRADAASGVSEGLPN